MGTDEKAKKTILIVDDVEENVQILSFVLSQQYRVLAATNGRKAVQIAKNQPPPDLILLDVLMPDLNGFEACTLLKSDITTSRIPVIFVTALTETIDEQMGYDLGAVDYITKPIDPDDVLTRVKAQIG